MNHSDPTNLYAAFSSAFPSDLAQPLLTDNQETTYSYQYAENKSAQIANMLKDLGLNPGDRVTVQVEKSPAALWLYLGVVRAGMVFHPLNTSYTDDELAYFLGDAEPAMAVCDPARKASFNKLCSKNSINNLFTLDADGNGDVLDIANEKPEQFDTYQSQLQDLAALLYSSGTTGRPKGIMLTHANLIQNARVLVNCWGFSAEDCLLHALPIFHVHGLFVAIGCVLMSGAQMRWLASFHVDEVIDALPRSTVMMGVPTYYTRLLSSNKLALAATDPVRLFVSGSAPLLKDTFDEFEALTGKAILERYGMTETGINTSNPLNGERRAGTVGLPLTGLKVRVTDAQDQPLGTDEVGDLQVKGPNVFSGYWKMPEKTTEDFTEDGFFITGDKASIDKDNYVSIVGRSKDMIITGGLNVYPKEIELCIDEISGIVESAVIGLPDTDFGEMVAAIIVAENEKDLDKDVIITTLKSRIANFKVPKQIFFVDSLPRNNMGKVQKNQLRKIYSSLIAGT